MNINAAFLTLETTQSGGYVGAILVTDQIGIPQEFRCTHRVVATKVQQQLYGGTLKPHIGIELCGLPLLKEIKSKPNLIILKDSFLLALREKHEIPTIFLSRAEGIIETSDTKSSSEKLEGDFEPIIVKTHQGCNSDLNDAMSHLRSLRLDPLEPFVRIQTALQALAEQEVAKYG